MTGSFYPLGDRAGRITCTFPAERPARRFAEEWANSSDNTALGRLLGKAAIHR
jgi:hypothetical protein